jgi:hypothetical protein
VSTAATLIQNFETYEWNAQVYAVLSLASRLATAVKSKSNTLRLAYNLHKTNRSLDALFERVHAVLEGRVPLDPNAEPVTPERLRSVADTAIQLHQTLDYIFEAGKRAGLLNNSVIAGALRRLGSFRAELLDLADWFESVSEPERTEELFERSRQERERGEVFDIDQVG